MLRPAPASLPTLPPQNFAAHLSELASTRADDVALTFLDAAGETHFSYAVVDKRARAAAAALHRVAAAGDRALIMLDTGIDYAAAFFGCLQSGVIAVPAFPPEPRRAQHQARLAAIILDAEPCAIFVQRADAEAVTEMLSGTPVRAEIIICEDIAPAPDAAAQTHLPGPDDVALLQYTSGSTSEPKGVMVSHANLMANARQMRPFGGDAPGDRGLSWLPLYHDMGLMGGLLQPIFVGVPGILMPPKHFLARPRRWLEAISRHRATSSGGPDFAYKLCVDLIPDDALAGLDLSCWKVAFSGSEPVRAATMDAFATKFAPAGFDARAVHPCYGLAEATLFVSVGGMGKGIFAPGFAQADLAKGLARAEPDGVRVVSCGKPGEEQRVIIADPETGEALPEGRVGEIVVSGPNVALGYWRKPEATARTFPLRGGRRQLVTGDLGFMRGGELHIAGRSKDLIIIRGQNIYPQDIEQRLESELELLRQGRIAAFPAEIGGREGIGIAVEVARSVQKLTQPEALAQLIGQTVSEAFLEPARVVVLLNPGALPRTSSGKLQRAATRQGWLARSLDAYAVVEDGAAMSGAAAPTESQADWTEGERALAAIWSEVLGRPAVGRDEHFFAAGGTSISAMQMAARLGESGVTLEMSGLFATPTIRSLAADIERRKGDGTAAGVAIVPAPRGERSTQFPLSAAQARLWFLGQLGGSAAVYHIAGGLRLSGTLDETALRRALDRLVERHEALRTRMRRLPGGDAEQEVLSAASVELAQADLSGFDDRERRLAELSAAEARAPFDLEAGPLLRATLVRLASDEHVLLITLHHIIADGWSIGVLLKELLAIYAGDETALTPLPVQYADYAVWQARFLEAGAMARQLDYWRQRLDASAPPLPLPLDRPRPAAASLRGGAVGFALDAALSAKIRALAAAHQATPVMVLIAAFKALLARYTGEPDIRIGLAAAGRGRPETEAVTGLFVNTLVLRTRLDGAATFAEALAATRETLIGAQSHQDVPFEKLVEALSPERSLAHAPLVQIAYTHQPAALGTLPPVPGLGVEAFGREAGGQQFDLALETREDAGGLIAGRFGYALDLFREATVARLAKDYAALLDAVTADPSLRLDAIALVSPEELDRLSAPYPAKPLADAPVHALIAAHAAAGPDAPAVICADETLSRAQLEAMANRIAHRLLRLGVEPEARVGIMLPRSGRLIAALLGVLKAGAAFLPLDPA
uniref:condensation domain-containing protein n=1 Tax=Rhodomicrobium sp. R_RK_3 TaxID=2029567 RepID=UPI001481E943